MSRVWSCNEWDPLEEVIVGNPLKARYPTPDLSTQLAEFPDRPLADIPRGPFPQRIIEETDEDLNEFAQILEKAGVTVQRPDTWPPRSDVLDHQLGIPGLLQLLPARHYAGDRRPDHRDTQRHPQPRPRDLQLSPPADRVHEIGRAVVQRPPADAPRLPVRRRRSREAHAAQRRAGLRRGEHPALRRGLDLSRQRHRQRDGGALAAEDSRRQIPDPLPQGRLFRQPHRLDNRGPAARLGPLQSRSPE